MTPLQDLPLARLRRRRDALKRALMRLDSESDALARISWAEGKTHAQVADLTVRRNRVRQRLWAALYVINETIMTRAEQ